MHERFSSTKDVELHVAFSGGGYRAAAFCLGVLACLIDQNLLSRVRSITSVSGGSFLNVFIDQHFDVDGLSSSDARKLVNDFARRLATRSIYFAGPRMAVFTVLLMIAAALMAASLLALLVSVVAWPELRTSAAVVLAGAAAVCVLLLSIRNSVLISAIRSVLSLGGEWRSAKPHGSQSRGRRHVVCATDLVRGEPVFFSHDGVRCRSFGQAVRVVDPAQVIAFSAAFPGLMRPFRVKAGDLFPSIGRAAEGDLVLVDGGVVNNLGTQWWEPAAGGGTGTFTERVVTIVADATVALPSWVPARLQPSKTLAAASRVFSLIYFNSVRPRFDSHRRLGPLSGSTAIGVSLAESPAQALRANMVRDLDGRTTELSKLLLGRHEEMIDTAVRAQSVTTGLTALGSSAVRDLVAHGYYLAMIELAGVALDGRHAKGPILEDWFKLTDESRR